MNSGGQHELRPYYDPDTFNAGYLVIFKPGVGLIDTETRRPLWEQVFGTSSPNSPGIGIHNATGRTGSASAVASASALSSDKNYAYDLEISEYFDTTNLVELLKNLLAGFARSYCRIALSQPLEIVRLILQVGEFDFSQNKQIADTVGEASEADDDEVVEYFKPKSQVQDGTGPEPVLPPISATEAPLTTFIKPISNHTVDILTAIFAKDGPMGVFRGVNASFIYHTLAHTIEAWITGFLSPILGVPDPFFLELGHLNDPVRLLWLSLAASVATGLILMPLDLIRVRLMITNFCSDGASKRNNRLVRESVREFPVHYLLFPSVSVLVLTALHQLLLTIFRKAAPYAMFVKFNIDAYGLPTTYTLANLFWLILELFIKLPVENVLRKEQLRFLLMPKPQDPHNCITIPEPGRDLVAPVNAAYTVLDIPLWQRITSLGLFNGWRVGVLNVVAFWGLNILKGSGQETQLERL